MAELVDFVRALSQEGVDADKWKGYSRIKVIILQEDTLMLNVYLEIFDKLNKYKVRYVLIRDLAANIYGVNRGTKDMDIFIEPILDDLIIANPISYEPK